MSVITGLLGTWPGRVGVLVLVGAVGGGGVLYARGNTAAPKGELRTAAVARGSVSQTVSVSGSVSALGQARLAFKTGGKLSQVYVTTGQAVTAGQPLAKLDAADLETALATAQQSLANAQAGYQKQLLAASDTQRSLEDTQKSTANDIATAQSTYNKLKSNYAAAKTNFGSFTTTAIGELGTYRTAIDGLRGQVQQAITDLYIYGTTDVNSARTSLTSADGSLANAQTYAGGLMAAALTDHAGSRDAILAAVARFDAALEEQRDTSDALATYQTAQLNYNIALSRLTGAVDTVAAQVTSAQTSVNSAMTSMNTPTSRSIAAFDASRATLVLTQTNFTNQSTVFATAKTRLTQSATPLATVTDAVSGSLVNAQTAIGTAQDRAATSVRTARSAVASIPFNLQSAQVSVDSANNAVATAKANLDNAVLTAPAAGVVASIANQVGEFVTGGNTNSAFIVLTNTTSMVLHGTIGESDVSKLRLGQVANVIVDALGGQRMTGKIVSLDPVATIQSGVPVYGIDIAVDVPAASLRAGMSGTASVILASKQNVLTVPNTTIRTVSGQRGVQVLKDGEVVDTAVTFGLANDTVTEVVSGLAEGDVVVIPQARAAATSAQPNRGGGVIVPGVGGAGR
jgi:RND family efflux transporter MFP subunit